MGELIKLPNIGKDTERLLNLVGIYSKEELESIGSIEAWVKIREIDSSACVNRLMGIEGAIQGIRWHNLSESDKQRLKDFYAEYKK